MTKDEAARAAQAEHEAACVDCRLKSGAFGPLLEAAAALGQGQAAPSAGGAGAPREG